MIWTKGICGYKDFRPRYSTDIVYNNFPWPVPTKEQRTRIEQMGRAIINVRRHHPECTLADLYDEATMPDDLRNAHLDNDEAVRKAYGFGKDMSDEEIIAQLLQLYKKLIEP